MSSKTEFTPASQLIKYVEELNQEKIEVQRKKIKSLIESCKSKGNCSIDDHIYPDVEKELVAAGYTVSFCSSYEESYWTITWGHRI